MRPHEFNDSSYLLKEMTMRAGKINDNIRNQEAINSYSRATQMKSLASHLTHIF